MLVLDEQWPVGYLQVYCDAVIDRDPTLVVDVMMAVGGRMSGEPLGEEARPFVEQMAIDEGRVVVRCRPYATFATPPRHLHSNDQEEKLTHWMSGSVPWDAADSRDDGEFTGTSSAATPPPSKRPWRRECGKVDHAWSRESRPWSIRKTRYRRCAARHAG